MRLGWSIAWLIGACVFGMSTGCTSESEPNDDDGNEGGGGSDPVGGGDPGTETASVRIVHASADAPAVDIWVKGGTAPIATGLEYGDASAWIEVPPGSYDVEIKASPSTADSPVVFSTGAIDLEDGDKLSAVAAGLLGSTADANKFRVLPVFEDFAPSGSGSAILRVVHASPDAPSVGIDLHDDDPTSPELTNIDRFTSTAQEGFPLTAGEKMQIGIAAGGQKVTAFTTPELPEGAEILVIATGLVAEPGNASDGFALLAIGPDGALGFVKQNPLVYALHASPDAPSVVLYAGSTQLTKPISFGDLADPVQVPPGDYAIDFRAAGADPGSDPAVTAQTGMLEAGNRYLSTATGFLGQSGAQGFRLVSFAETFQRDASTESRVRVVHGSPDAPMVDLGVLNVEGVVNPVLIGGLAFGSASEANGLNIGLGTVPIGVTPAGQNNTVVASFHVPTAAGIRAFAVASGALAAQGQTFRLIVVETSTTPWTVATVHPQPQ